MGCMKTQLLLSQGYFLAPLELPADVRTSVIERNWEELDAQIRVETLPGGGIFKKLAEYADFSEIEFIVSIRSSHEYPDEDGIWHDDGSRVLAFSLSLTLEPDTIKGGVLEIRRRAVQSGSRDHGKEEKSSELITPPYGTMIVFATGHFGFEHKINRVVSGERIIIAGWCT
jgi:hypothetical protein